MAKIHILLIDDDPANLDSLKGYLEDICQYAVSDHTEINPALEDLRNHPYDVLIMDWTVKPGGKEILDRVQEIASDLPIIVCTGNAEAGAEAYGQGAYAYFQKPVRLERLVQTIQGAANKNRGPEEKSLELVNAIGALLVEQQTLGAFANAIISKANSLVGSSAGCFCIWNWKENNFQKLASSGSVDVPQEVSPAASTAILQALAGETGILINTQDEAFRVFLNSKGGSQAVMLLHRGDLHLGLLALDKPQAEFTDQDKKTLRAMKTLVEPLLEQMKVRDLLQKVESEYYTTKEGLGEAVVNGLFELFGKPNALWLINDGYTEFKIQSAYGLPDGYKKDACIRWDDENSLLVALIKTGKADQRENTETLVENPQLSELIGLDEPVIQSLRAIPLFTSEGAPLGAIALYGIQPNTLKDYDLQLAQNFAALTAKVLENLRRQWQSKKLAELSETLAATGQDEKSIFETFAKAMLELSGAYNVAIYPSGPKQKYWVDTSQVIIQGPQLLEEKTLTERPREKGLASIVRNAGEILVEDIRERDVLIQPVKNWGKKADKTSIVMRFVQAKVADAQFIKRENIRAFAGISLRAPQMQAEVGVMYVNFQTPRRFTESEISNLEIAARQVASIIHSHRLSVRQQIISNTLKEIINVIGTTNQLSAILEQTAKLFSVDYASIGRLTEDGQHLQYQFIDVTRKTEQKTEQNASRPIGAGIIGHVIRSKKSFRAGDVSKIGFYDPVFAGTQSEMAFPLENAFGDVIGVLNLESMRPDFFTEEDEKLCGSFARAASAAIQQSELIEAIQSLHYLTESHTLKDLLDQVLRNLNKMIGKNSASIINLYDAENTKFHIPYIVSSNQEFAKNYSLVTPRKNGTGQYVLEKKQALWYDDVNHIPEGLPKMRPEAMEQKVVSFAALPLMYQNKILGVLFIHKIEEKAKFKDDGKHILETYADQAALAIHNAQHLIEVELLKEILDATVSRNQEEILNLIVEKAVGVVTADYSSLFMGEAEGLVRKAIYIRPEEQGYFLPRSDMSKSNQGSIPMTVCKSGKPIIDNDVSEREKQGRYNRSYQKAQSEIAVPLVFRGEVIGTLNAESQYLGAYSEFDLTTLRVFADIAAIAIKVSQNIEELDRRNHDLDNMNYLLKRRNTSFEALTEIGQQLTANIQRGEKQILAIIHQQASRIMDTQNMYIALYQAEKDLVHFELAFLDGIPVDINNDKDWQPRSGGYGRTEWIIRHKAPILIYTKADAEAWYQQPGARDYIGETFASWLGVPILFGEDVLGVIATYHKTDEYKYSPDDMKMLALMGRQAAIALTNARLVRLLDKRIVELDTIRELGEDLSQGALSS